MEFTGKNNEYLLLAEITSDNCYLLKERLVSGLTILWGEKAGIRLKIDEQEFELAENEILFLTEFHKVEVLDITQAKLVKFNRPFYCIRDHDAEVSCKGLLFFGASQVPRIQLSNAQVEQFGLLWKVFEMEIQSRDHLQFEMLQMLLKRLIILSTRLFKQQNEVDGLKKLDIVREFNYLVETHFTRHHAVADYADLLHKSPKTLSNLFARYKQKTPLQIIHDRILLEAMRLLSYSDKAIKEIAYELGYEDVQSFSRFFKARSKYSPKKYRDIHNTGKIDNKGGKIA